MVQQIGLEARQVRDEVHPHPRLVVGPIGVAWHRDALQPGQGDLVEDDQGLVVVSDPEAAKLEPLHGPDKRLLEDLLPPPPVPVRQLGLHSIEERARQQATELHDDLDHELPEALGQALDARDRGLLARVHLVHLAHAARRRAARSGRVVVQPVDVPTEGEGIEHPRTQAAALSQERVPEIRGDGDRPLAGRGHVRRLAVADQRTPSQGGEGGLEVVGRHVLQRPVGHQVTEEQLVARGLEQDVHQEREPLPQAPEALQRVSAVGSPGSELRPGRGLGRHACADLGAPVTPGLGQVTRREGVQDLLDGAASSKARLAATIRTAGRHGVTSCASPRVLPSRSASTISYV